MNIRSFEGIAPTLGARVYVDPQACVIGRVTLGDDVTVWPLSVLRGDIQSIRVGARSNIQDGSVLHVTSEGPRAPGGLPLVLGEEVTVGHKALLHACTIGDRCLIGMGAIVLDAAVVESEVIVGAGSVVPPRARLRSRTLWLGNPAREVRALTEREIANFATLAAHYVRLKESYGVTR